MKKFNYIYLITNKVNGKIYIGKHSTNKLDDGYMGSGVIISKAKQKYGIDSFTKEYLSFCDSEETLNFLERFYIKKYKAKDVGYNLTDGGEGALGLKHSEESKEKNRQARLGKKASEETKQKISNATKGEKNPFYNKHHSEETKKIIQEHTKKQFKEKGNPFKGKHHSEESKRKLSDARIGKHYPKLSEAKKGHATWNKGIKVEKFKWLTPLGEIKEMDMNNVKRWHSDWTLLN